MPATWLFVPLVHISTIFGVHSSYSFFDVFNILPVARSALSMELLARLNPFCIGRDVRANLVASLTVIRHPIHIHVLWVLVTRLDQHELRRDTMTSADESVILTQQMTPTDVMSPPRVTSALSGFASTAVGAKPSFAYTVSSVSLNSSALPIIWALASSHPARPPMRRCSTAIPTTTSTGDVEHKRSTMIIDHGIFCIIRFLVLLLGVLIALRTRTFTTQWFAGTQSRRLR
ncbi:hypothetical protein FIBSPDRAFT_1054575 [Athelia psychrophila]|uniref:Uncharacterized protein n=1 Tax=Athelia psychrophila TaxID=1759441 RepID=A0A167V3H3_9AGAM|nr:hypothetical protein FIBSPDRAFT_1054575 [Fibularhizoctonia sp. CBS 109695]